MEPFCFGVTRGEQPLVCNGDDRRQRRKQGGTVGAAACRMRVPPKARSRRREPQPVASSASKSLALFWFSFGVKREHPPTERLFIKAIKPAPTRLRSAREVFIFSPSSSGCGFPAGCATARCSPPPARLHWGCGPAARSMRSHRKRAAPAS